MKNKSFDVFIVCNGYSKYLNISLYYWLLMSYSKTDYRINVVFNSLDQDTLNILNKYNNLDLNINIIDYKLDNFNYKGLLLKQIYDCVKNDINDYVIFSDADILFFPDLLLRLNLKYLNNKSLIISSYREDLDEDGTIELLNNYNNIDFLYPWNFLNRKIISPSPFMGWFLCVESIYLSDIDFYINHNGYDLIDWKIYGQLRNLKLNEEIMYFDNQPLHLYHGQKAKNWKGLNI